MISPSEEETQTELFNGQIPSRDVTPVGFFNPDQWWGRRERAVAVGPR